MKDVLLWWYDVNALFIYFVVAICAPSDVTGWVVFVVLLIVMPTIYRQFIKRYEPNKS
jgi:hypothetical protein